MPRRPQNPYMRGFQVATGMRRGFRRGSGPASLLNICVAAAVGVVSGQYIFKEPLEQYWKEKRLEEARAGKAPGGQPQPNNTS